MLEICPTIAGKNKVRAEVHPLGIGGKEDPVRLVFDAAGLAINASLVDLGNRFRLIVNEVNAIAPPHASPKLPVARAVGQCRPDFKTACAMYLARMDNPLHHRPANRNFSPRPAVGTGRRQDQRGPAALLHGNRVFITHSAAKTDASYCLGLLSADADLLDPKSWD